MKKRMGFVSNSSSSSFVIGRDVVSETQLNQIINHIEFSKEMTPVEWNDTWYNHKDNAWDIDVSDTKIYGYVFMNNFCMEHFLREIGVADKDISWN